ncbi:hypothetical protein J3R82DRAFT_1034 [Butyriboletus roseoflavus]|nr:hypothetical protein J3R82DRAFT_1034 [Butyriboletus roseoflavus]
MVMTPTYQIPFVISEVIPNKQESDRSRMLVEAIALARAGNFLLRSTSKRSFFVVAIYVGAKMNASRYIVMQTGRGNTQHENSHYHNEVVSVDNTDASGYLWERTGVKDFELTTAQQEVDFLRDMYNPSESDH